LNEWPNRANEHLKSKFPNQRSAIVARLNEEYERVLYVQASTLRAFHPVSKLPTVLIGEGLFARIVIQNNAHIADYKGELISVEEAELRSETGHGGYMIYINDTTRMDCYEKSSRGLCKASKANSNTRCFNTVTQTGAIVNAKMVMHSISNGEVRVRLKAVRKIAMHTEIITNYGRGFRYPSAQVDEDNADDEDQDDDEDDEDEEKDNDDDTPDYN